jgi:hypothetical protein
MTTNTFRKYQILVHNFLESTYDYRLLKNTFHKLLDNDKQVEAFAKVHQSKNIFCYTKDIGVWNRDTQLLDLCSERVFLDQEFEEIVDYMFHVFLYINT